MLISIEYAASIAEVPMNYFATVPQLKACRVKIDKNRFKIDSEKLQKYLNEKRDREDRARGFSVFARFLIALLGEEEFIQQIRPEYRNAIQSGLHRGQIAPSAAKQIEKSFERYRNKFDRYLVEGYIAEEDRRAIDPEYIKHWYWSGKKTTRDMAEELLVPLTWIEYQIRLLGLGKKANGVPPRGRKGWQPADMEAYSRARRNQPHARPVVQIDPVTEQVVQRYPSVGATKKYGFQPKGVWQAMRTNGLHLGYLWCRPGMEEITIRIARRRDTLKRLRQLSVETPDPETFRRLYVDLRLSKYDIAEILGCSPGTVPQYASKLGIHRPKRPKLTPKMLHEMYIGQGLTAAQIAEKTDRTKSTIATYLSRLKFNKKSEHEK